MISRKTFFTIGITVIAVALTARFAHAFNQKHLDQLMATKKCPGCDLRGARLNGMDLSDADLSGAKLDGACLSTAAL
jgi:uncharacterized protein YjbI with pentapeptide repeats